MKNNILIVQFIILSLGGFTQSTIFYTDTIDFEKPCNYLYIDSSNTNLWQIGIPNKLFFDSAYSMPFAIITDTLNYYSSNNHSSFILKLEPESFGEGDGITIIRFWHKFDTDSINDYGVVEVSYDEGNEWKVLYTDTTYSVHYSRNDSYTESYLATGQSNDWVFDNIEFDFYLTGYVIPDSIWLRFSFYSDDVQNENEGWMIDNIQITGVLPWGIEDNSIFYSYPYPNPCHGHLSIGVPRNENVNFTLLVYDLFGKIFKSKKFENDQININTNRCKNGVYFYKIINNENGKTSHGRFIVKK